MRTLSKPQIKLAKQLTYSGTFPFLLCASGLYFHCHWIDFQMAAITYAMLIIAFLSGIHWAIYLSSAKRCPYNLLIRSNYVTLLAYTTCFITEPLISLSLELFCFQLLLRYDSALQQLGILPPWFYQLRRNATLIVSALLIIIAILCYTTRLTPHPIMH